MRGENVKDGKSGMVHPSVAINNGYKGVPEDSGNNRNQNDKTNY